MTSGLLHIALPSDLPVNGNFGLQVSVVPNLGGNFSTLILKPTTQILTMTPIQTQLTLIKPTPT